MTIFSGHRITTEQLAVAMKEISTMLGSKIELYGSDACLMAMAEVTAQMADSVKFFLVLKRLSPAKVGHTNNFRTLV